MTDVGVRRVAAGWLLALLVALGLGLWLLVPWGTLPDPSAAELRRSFTGAEIGRGDRFSGQVRPPTYLSMLVGLALLVGLTLTRPGLALLRRLAGRSRRWWLQVPVAVLGVSAAGWLVTLPLGAWRWRVLRVWELSTQSFGAWLVDGLKALGITAGLTAAGLLLLVWLARRMPRWWFVPASLGSVVLTFAMSFAYPVLFEPVFNSFMSMQAGPLRTDLLTLAERDGVQVDDVLVADASRRTTSLNAYVSGFGTTRRIVVYDNLLAEATPEEVEVIVAHELGHADANDVLTGSILSALAGATGVTLLWWVLGSGWVRRRGVEGAADPMAATVVLGLAAVSALLLAPATSGISRQVEARADRHALELSRQPETVISMQQRLAIHNISDLTPPRWTYLAFATHPSSVQRIELARRWAQDNG